MNELATVLFVLACIAGSAVYSGSETGLYSISRPRLDLLVREGSPGARLVSWLLGRDAAMLITILIGNNLLLELLTRRTQLALGQTLGLGGYGNELVVSALLTPVVFFFGEVLPKDLFRRRPLALLRLTAPFVIASRYLLWPLERVVWLLAIVLERVSGARRQDLARRPGREAVLHLVEESARAGVLPPRAERLVKNALELRRIPAEVAMVPWERVQTIRADLADEEARAGVLDSPYTRLPVVGEGGTVQGYVYGLDVLRDPGRPVLAAMRPIASLPPETPVDRALARLRVLGQRLAVVGDPAAPVGIVTLKDLLEEISGDLGDW